MDSSTARAASSGCSASSAHWSGWPANRATVQPSWLRVVSVPPTMTASTIETSSDGLRRSPSSSAAIRAVRRSSAGRERRSSISRVTYSSSSSCVRMMIGASSTRLPLKTRSRSEAQRLNCFQSSFGAPSSWQMIGIG